MNNTLQFFKEISNIPRPSGKEEKIRDYLVNFAKSHNLEYVTDNTFNVIIKKPSNIANCNKTLILQAHTDMVCEKNNDTFFDFDNMGINIIEKDDFLFADGTTLGADNGIGLSMILSILEDKNLKIPNLECVFTAQEETTMKGAMDLNFANIQGNHLLSIDGTDEGKIEVSSAGMVVAKLTKNLDFQDVGNKNIFKITITGLKGGHSGTEINTERENAIKILFEGLSKLKNNFQISSVSGGGKSNAIPRECKCVIATNENIENIEDLFNNVINNYKNNEPNINCTVSPVNYKKCINSQETINLIDFINAFKNGVLVYSEKQENFPITSCNLANIILEDGTINIIISLRSSLKTQEKEYLNNIFELCNKYKITYKILSSAPFFEKKENSYLQKICKDTYKSLFNIEAEVKGVHAGLEGGVFANKNENLDICVIAPNIYDAHSPKERVSISSVNRVYKWLRNIIENF